MSKSNSNIYIHDRMMIDYVIRMNIVGRPYSRNYYANFRKRTREIET